MTIQCGILIESRADIFYTVRILPYSFLWRRKVFLTNAGANNILNFQVLLPTVQTGYAYRENYQSTSAGVADWNFFLSPNHKKPKPSLRNCFVLQARAKVSEPLAQPALNQQSCLKIGKPLPQRASWLLKVETGCQKISALSEAGVRWVPCWTRL